MGFDVCPYWLSFILENGLRRAMHDPQEILAPYVKPGDAAVDIGCGPGYFTLPMAELVGDSGKVIAVDVQEKMLQRMMGHAWKKGVDSRIIPHKCQETQVGLTEKADFVLTFWMVHEVPDAQKLITEIASMLKPGGKYLLVEHLFVPKFQYNKFLKYAGEVGLQQVGEVKAKFSRGMLFTLSE
ncbi:MAG: class I SAM-dependent methyltransferase [Candidatus Saccharibacteria bacterium]